MKKDSVIVLAGAPAGHELDQTWSDKPSPADEGG
jgi:hypothetical protein